MPKTSKKLWSQQETLSTPRRLNLPIHTIVSKNYIPHCIKRYTTYIHRSIFQNFMSPLCHLCLQVGADLVNIRRPELKMAGGGQHMIEKRFSTSKHLKTLKRFALCSQKTSWKLVENLLSFCRSSHFCRLCSVPTVHLASILQPESNSPAKSSTSRCTKMRPNTEHTHTHEDAPKNSPKHNSHIARAVHQVLAAMPQDLRVKVTKMGIQSHRLEVYTS